MLMCSLGRGGLVIDATADPGSARQRKPKTAQADDGFSDSRGLRNAGRKKVDGLNVYTYEVSFGLDQDVLLAVVHVQGWSFHLTRPGPLEWGCPGTESASKLDWRGHGVVSF